MESKSEFPQEIVDMINNEAKSYSEYASQVSPHIAYTRGATAWAQWLVKYDAIESELHGVRAENVRLQSEIKKANESNFNLQESNDQWKVKYEELKKVLQEFVTRHEGGLLPDRFVYEKAIKILNDGTTTNNAGQD
jgi:hypothetical protein